jgi:hypothetical protein
MKSAVLGETPGRSEKSPRLLFRSAGIVSFLFTCWPDRTVNGYYGDPWTVTDVTRWVIFPPKIVRAAI